MRTVLALAFSVLAFPPLRADDLATIAGKKVAGRLVAVDAQTLTFRANDIDVKVPAKEVLAVEFGNKIPPPPKDLKFDEVELTDGSALRCAKFLIKGKAFDLTPAPGPAGVAAPAAVVPLPAVFAAMRNADDPQARADWRKTLAGRGKRDLYVIRQAEGLNFLPGTLIEGNAAGDAVTFEKEDGQRTTLKLSRASGGLVLNQPPQAVLPPTLCKVLDVFGNVLFAQAIEFQGSAVKVTTVAGATVSYAGTEALAKLDYAQGNIAYLSDLDPQVAAADADPLEPRFTWNRDKNQLNEPLRLDGVPYAKGLWLFADTSLTFAIGGDYREFKAVVGTDDTIANGTTAVKLTVEADGRVLHAETVRRTDKPRLLNLDVKGVKQLKISVESDTPYNGNQVILAEARVQK